MQYIKRLIHFDPSSIFGPRMEHHVEQANQILDVLVNHGPSEEGLKTSESHKKPDDTSSLPSFSTHFIMKRLKRSRELDKLPTKSSSIMRRLQELSSLPIFQRHTRFSNFRPFDRSAYIARLSSYTFQNWLYPPNLISPTECARYGWQAIGLHRIQCVFCKLQLSVEIKESLLPHHEELQVLCKHFRLQLNEAHSKTCPWKNHPSPGKPVYMKSHANVCMCMDCFHSFLDQPGNNDLIFSFFTYERRIHISPSFSQ